LPPWQAGWQAGRLEAGRSDRRLKEPWQDYEDALREEEEEEEDHMLWVVVADQLEQISDHGDNNDRDWRDLDSDMDSFDKAVADAKTRQDALDASACAQGSCLNNNPTS
jgi:hypothetical protein